MSEQETSAPSVNVLRDVRWIRTTEGMLSPYELFMSRNAELNLDEEVPGYIYGAQYRFLMTVYALLAKEEYENASRGELFSTAAVERVFRLLDPYADLFSPEAPFLQVTPEDITPELEGELREPEHLPGKLLPQGQVPTDNQVNFWNINANDASFSLSEAVLALVSYYFYGVGTNTKLTGKAYTRLQNGSSALRYLGSVEIIPQGVGVLESLAMSTPRKFVLEHENELLPHWADRTCSKTSMNDPLWRFSWSSNAVYCKYNEDYTSLEAVVRGAIPIGWTASPPVSEGESWAKNYHDLRQLEDPLYFYRIVKDELKLWRYMVGSDPYYAIAQWHFESLSEKIKDKLTSSILGRDDELLDLVMLEHATEGAANSFSVRYSKVVRGWKDELIPPEGLENLQTVAANVLAMKSRLTGLFSEKGTCSHLNPRRGDAENEYWGRVQSVLEDMVHEDLKLDEANTRIKRAAIEAYEAISSIRDTSNIKAHMNGLQLLQSFKI